MDIDEINEIVIKTTRDSSWKTAYNCGHYQSYKPKWVHKSFTDPIKALFYAKSCNRIVYPGENPSIVIGLKTKCRYSEVCGFQNIERILTQLIWQFRDQYDPHTDKIFDVEIFDIYSEVIDYDDNSEPIYKDVNQHVITKNSLTESELKEIYLKIETNHPFSKITYHGKMGIEILYTERYGSLLPGKNTFIYE